MIKDFLVVIQGNFVHPTLRITFLPTSRLYEMSVTMRDRVFNLKCPHSIPWGVIDRSGLIGQIKTINPY